MDKTKIFNILLIIVIILLMIMSIIAIITLHWTFFSKEKYSFSFTPEGINNYLTAYGTYKVLFTVTIATMTAYFGLLRLKAATDANNDKLKQDRFLDWKTVLDIRFIEIERYDPLMRREFTRIRYNLFRQLYDLNFSIDNNIQLTQIFHNHFQGLANFFEIQNNRYIGMGGVYPDAFHSYSFISFQFLLLGSVDRTYPEILHDLRTLYLAALPADRRINPVAYQAATLNYHPINNA